LALRIMLSVQLLGELLLPPNHEPFELLLIEGNHEELCELDGYHDDDEELIEGHQLELDEEENIVEASATPTPSPTPKTASTVDSGYSSMAFWACD